MAVKEDEFFKLMARLNISYLEDRSDIVKITDSLIILSLLCGMVLLNSCIKDPTIPTVATYQATEISINSVSVSGKITDDGGEPVTVAGICWGTAVNPSIEGLHTNDSTGSIIFTSTITGLDPNTLYYARAYAVNNIGIAYGNEIRVTTNAAAPQLTTLVVSAITTSTATSGGKITYAGGADIIAKGICWSTFPDPDTSDMFINVGVDTSSFSSQMTGLSPGNRYFVRAYAKNKAGIAYGNQVIFNTKIADVEGNLYNTVVIGTQVWMAENLRTTKYNTSVAIPNVTVNANWISLTTGAYCWYNNDITFKPSFGALYNWFAVKAGQLCPTGWHVPTDEEFKTLELSLGMDPGQVDVWGWRGTDQGTQMKNVTGWDTGGNGTNSSGFSALPGGYRYGVTGAFYLLTSITYWWNSTEHDADRGWYRRLDSSRSDIYKASTSKKGGKYIRCLKN